MASAKPESILLASHLWLWVVGLEILHQILAVVMQILAPEELVRQLKEQYPSRGTGISQSQMEIIVYFSIVVSGVFLIAICCVMLWTSVIMSGGGKYASFARRVMLFYGVFLGIRALLVFIPMPTTVSVAFVLVDGCIQIAAGVLAALAVYLVTRRESLIWTGEYHG